MTIEENLIGSVVLIVSYLIITILSLSIKTDKSSIWGYKTPASLKNETTWYYANTFAKRYQLVSFFIFLIISVACMIMIPSKSMTLTSVALTVLSISVIPVTEVFLSLVFDSKGEFKTKSK